MKKRIVLVGGGFAGINILNKLANNESFDIVLIDKNNYNFFPPLIYQVASSILEASAVSYPFRRFIRNKKNVSFRMAELKEVKPEENKIILSNGELSYDILIVATGTQTNYFGMENVEKQAIPMKTLNDALLMRNTMLERLEEASLETDLEKQKKLLSVVITGGGPAGVEIAGVLCEILKHAEFEGYRGFKSTAKVYLVEGSPDLLGPMSEKSHKESIKELTKLGVNVMVDTRVKDCDENAIYFTNGEKLDTRMIIWTAGVTSRVFPGLSQEIYTRGRRMQVDEFNKLQGYHNIYAVGDTCIMTTDPNFKEGHPQLAQVAIQQGSNLAKNIKNQLKGVEPKPFSYKDRGSMAIIGKNKAVADLNFNMFFKGFPAWMVWSCIHIISLVSIGNKMNTFYRWMNVYFFKSSSLGMNHKIGESE